MTGPERQAQQPVSRDDNAWRPEVNRLEPDTPREWLRLIEHHLLFSPPINVHSRIDRLQRMFYGLFRARGWIAGSATEQMAREAFVDDPDASD